MLRRTVNVEGTKWTEKGQEVTFIAQFQAENWSSDELSDLSRIVNRKVRHKILMGEYNTADTYEYRWTYADADPVQWNYIYAYRFSREDIEQWLVDYVYAGIGFIGERQGRLFYFFSDDAKGEGIVEIWPLGREGAISTIKLVHFREEF